MSLEKNHLSHKLPENATPGADLAYYESKIQEIQAKKAELLKRKQELETLEQEELINSPKKSTEISRRGFLKIGAAALSGVALTKAARLESIWEENPAKPGPALPNQPPKTENVPNPETMDPKTVSGEIKKCEQIVRGGKYEEVLNSPYLISALYYSENAVHKMAPPHESPAEEIIWGIRQFLTPEFRRNYINYLIEKFKNEPQLISTFYAAPLDKLELPKKLEENHLDAIDMFAKEGSPIYSFISGVVVLSEDSWNPDDPLSTSSHRGGNSVIIFNPATKSFYRYVHMKKTAVRPGEILSCGEIIGWVGHTGINASKPGHGGHLHFEINQYDQVSSTMVPEPAFELKNKLALATTPRPQIAQKSRLASIRGKTKQEL